MKLKKTYQIPVEKRLTLKISLNALKYFQNVEIFYKKYSL